MMILYFLYLLLMFIVYIGIGAYALLIESMFLLLLALVGGGLISIRLHEFGK